MTSKDDERLSALIRDGLRHLELAESGDQEDDFDFAFDYATEIEEAIDAFKEATELAPGLPWLWFQIGWLSAVEEASPDDLDTARVALERALGLDPYYFTAHLALASVISQSATLDAFDPPMWSDFLGLVEKQTAIERQIVSPNDPVERTRLQGELDAIRAQVQETFLDLSGRWFESNWNGPLGEHICTAVGEDDSHPLWYDMPRSIEGTDITLENYPFATEESFWHFVDLLDELAFFVPVSKKAWYYNAVGLSFETDNWVIFDKRFFEKATQQVTGDPVSLFSAHRYLGRALTLAEVPDYAGACKSFLKAYSYLLQLPDLDDQYWNWLCWITLPDDWNPGDDWPTVRQLVSLALDKLPLSANLMHPSLVSKLVTLAEAGAKIALKRSERQLAVDYLLSAQHLDPTRTSIARLLAEVSLDEKHLSKALEEFRRIIAIDPTDTQALRLIPVLELAQEGTLNKQARDLILTVLPDLRAGQEMILDELSLQRDLMQRVADAQNRAQIELGQPRNEERAYAELFDQLHRLVQEGSRIQPAAWHSARSRLVDKLGSEVYGSLQGTDSQHFLITAEVFFTASRDVKAMTDAAPIAVEYAKVVETELKERFLSDVGAYLDLKKHVQGLRCGNDNIGKQQAGSWMVTMKRLGLGQVGHLLMSIAEGVNDDALGDYLKSRGIRRDLLDSIGENVLKIAGKYRNGAAHTRSLTRGDLEEFRELLFERETGLLYRLVELGRRIEAIRINQ